MHRIISVKKPRLSFKIMASSLLPSPGNSTVLTASEDWDRLIDNLRAYVHPELWTSIDRGSDNVEEFLEKPEGSWSPLSKPCTGSKGVWLANQTKIYHHYCIIAQATTTWSLKDNIRMATISKIARSYTTAYWKRENRRSRYLGKPG